MQLASVSKLLTCSVQAVIDNFSRRIIAWRVNEKLSSATTRELLIEASEDLPDAAANASVLVVTDGGSEKPDSGCSG